MKRTAAYTLPGHESEIVEFKSTFQDEVIITLVAFANAKGGAVYVGVDDKGDVRGVSLGKETVQKWLNEIKVKTQPALIPEVDILDEQDRQVVVFSMPTYPIKPVSYKGKYYKRVSNANHPMSVGEVAQMHLRTVNSSWDYFWRDRVTTDDISLDKVQHVLDMVKRRNPNISIDTAQQFLQKQELVNGEQISNACYLLFCKEDTYHTTIQMGHFASETVIKDDVTISTDIVTEVEEVMDFVRKHINKEVIITEQPENIERWQYPLEGIRELVVNMIVHRDYMSGLHSTIKIFPDSIVFFNSGSLPAHITMERLLSDDYVSFPRNLQIAKIFKEMGLIERPFDYAQDGTGIKRVRQLFLNHNLPEPEFKLVQEGFFVRVFASQDKPDDKQVADKENVTENEGLSEGLKTILLAIEENAGIQAKDLSVLLGNRPIKTIERQIAQLVGKGLIERRGSRKTGGYWKVK